MRKAVIAIEIVLSLCFVLIPTFFVYSYLSGFPSFWDTQTVWSIILAGGWVIVASGYYHQGWLIHKEHNARNVSIILPVAVFFIQCILFVKGVYYKDWSLIWGALVVNSGVCFSIYQNLRFRTRFGPVSAPAQAGSK